MAAWWPLSAERSDRRETANARARTRDSAGNRRRRVGGREHRGRRGPALSHRAGPALRRAEQSGERADPVRLQPLRAADRGRLLVARDAEDHGRYRALFGHARREHPDPPATWAAAANADSKLFLGIRVNDDLELSPRQPVLSVPYALVAENAVGDITPTSITVNGTKVIDSTGAWVGPSAGIQGPQGVQGSPGQSGPPEPRARKDPWESRAPRARRDPWESRAPRARKDPPDPRARKDPWESREPPARKDPPDPPDPRGHRGSWRRRS